MFLHVYCIKDMHHTFRWPKRNMLAGISMHKDILFSQSFLACMYCLLHQGREFLTPFLSIRNISFASTTTTTTITPQSQAS